MAVTPAGAEVSSAVATNWKKIWKKNLKPLADRRYYKKSASDAKYSTKTETAAGDAASNAATDSKLSGYYKKTETYSKAEADAKYAAAGSSYTKAESDAKYAPFPAVIRGSWSMMGGGDNGAYNSTDINYGYTFGASLTGHYIPSGSPLPVGCSGTVAAPVASPGHLCVFEYAKSGYGVVYIRNVSDSPGNTSPFGANLFSTSTSAGNVFAFGSWAARGGGSLPISSRPEEGPKGDGSLGSIASAD